MIAAGRKVRPLPKWKGQSPMSLNVEPFRRPPKIQTERFRQKERDRVCFH